jgi:hypothetical protein
MKSLFFLAAFAASVNALALFPRAEVPCCFHLNVSGEVTGPLGQLTDGQSRVGDNSLSQSLFCINSTGVITDSTGKGCIITREFIFCSPKSYHHQTLIQSHHQRKLLSSSVMKVNQELQVSPSHLLVNCSSMAANTSLLARLVKMVA